MADVFNTVNGPRSVGQMQIELKNAGWQGGEDVNAAYARTTGGAVTAGTPGSNVPGPATTTDKGFNKDAADAAMQLADKAAQQAYLRSRLNLDSDIEAHRHAEAVWRQTFDQAQALGYIDGQPTLAREAEQNKTALGFLDLASKLRGPSDPFQYLRTLQGTPRGLVDIVNAAAGRYQMGGAPSGEMSQRASVQGLIDQANGGMGNPLAGVGALPLAGQINAQAYNQMDPSQRAALWGAYEYGLGPGGAMRPEDAQAAYLRSLPKYAYSGGTGTVRL